MNRLAGRRRRAGRLAATLLLAAACVPVLGPVSARPAVALDLLPPVALPDSYTAKHDRVLTVAAPGVLGNDLDLDGGSTAVLDSGTTNGSVVLRSNGGFTYTPATGYVGTDRFRYHATGSLLDSLTVAVTITVTNTAPKGKADSYTGPAGAPLVVAAPGVLANDSDADGDELIAELVGGISHGSLDLDEDGAFTYQPSSGFSGANSFTYRIWDGVVWSGPIPVTLTIRPPEPTPTPEPTPPPTPKPTPTPTHSPTPTRSPTPRPTPTPTRTPSPTGTPTAQPTATPTPSLAPTPSASPTSTIPGSSATPSATPTGSVSPTPTGSASPTPLGGSTPTPGPTSTGEGTAPTPTPSPASGGGSGLPPGSGPGGGFAVGPPAFGPGDAFVTDIFTFGGFEWAVPALALTVPGLLVILALMGQGVIGLIWLPYVRRSLRGLGVRDRRRQARRTPA